MGKGMVIFSHGKESGPWGTKITRLAEVAESLGFDVLSIDYSGITDPDERVRLLLEAVTPSDFRLVLVGSSMGGYVSTVASATLLPNGLFLMAPAFYLPGYGEQEPIPCAGMTEIVHGWQDEVVPVENIIDFAARHSVTLHLIDDDHQLIRSLDQIAELFAVFLLRLQAAARIHRNTGWMCSYLTRLRDAEQGGTSMMKRSSVFSMQLDERLCTTLVNSIRGIVWELDPSNFQFSFVSPHAERILGYPSSRWIEEPDFWLSHTHPDDVERCAAYCRYASEKVEDHEFEYRMLAADGRVVWLHDIVTVVHADDNSVRLRGIMIDITETKLTEMKLRSGEERFSLAMQGASDGLWDWDLATDEVYYSPRWKSMLGYDDNELENHLNTWSWLVHPDDKESKLALVRDYLEGRLPRYETEFRLRHKNGHYITVLSRAFLSRDKEGKPVRMVGTHVDITSLKQAEEELYLAKFCLDRAPLGVMRFSPEGLVLEANDHACRSLGYSREELSRMTVFDFDPDFSPDIWSDHLRRMRAADSMTFETVHQRKDGVRFPTEITVNRLEYQGNEFLISFEKDITKRKMAEQEILLREYSLRALLDNFPFSAWMKDEEGRFLAANRQLAAHLGLESPKELVGKTTYDILPREIADRTSEEDRKVLSSGLARHDEEQLPVHGENRWFEVYQSPIKLKDRVIGTVGCTWDVTERKAMEKALKESEERYRRLVELSPDAVFIHTDGRFVFMNESAVRLLGAERPEDLYGTDPLDYVHPDYRDLVRKRIENALIQRDNPPIEELLVRIDGSMVAVEMVSVYFSYQGADSVLAIARDISERKRMQDELVKVQKLESLGVLAGGLAHDFNNILTGILGNVSLVRSQIDPSSNFAGRLESCEKAAIRASELTQQLLTFARGGEPVRRLMDPAALIRECTTFVLRGSNVGSEIVIADDLWCIEADAGQITQVLHNILINATQAMPEGGLVRVTAFNETLGPVNSVNLPSGNYLHIVIEDHGCGIPPENLPKIFDPYFTTRLDGNGLGLASVYSIIRRHGGTVSVSSTVGVGSSFTILLPAASGERPVDGRAVKETELAGSGRILVMDDEEIILEIATEILGFAGYHVESCAEGREAVSRYRNSLGKKTAFDAVIMDLTIPGGMGGREAAGLILEVDPDAVLIVSSGYSNDPVIANFRNNGFRGAIVKPFSAGALVSEVQRLIRKSR